MNTERLSSELTNTCNIFWLLVAYRWFSLIPPILTLVAGWPDNQTLSAVALGGAVVANLFITLFAAQLNATLQRRPWLIVVDLLFCALLAGLTNGWNTPYYLYTFSPLLAAAFFFYLPGAVLASTGMAALLIVAGLPTAEPNVLRLVAEVMGFFLIGGAFGYATTLLSRLRSSHAHLDRALRDLEVIHQLTLAMQSAADVLEVEETILQAVTHDLGFSGAVIALVEPNEQVITSWLSKSRVGQAFVTGSLPHPARVPLTPDGGDVAQCLLEGQPHLSAREVHTADEQVNAYLGTRPYHLFPMLLREHPVGVLLVEAADHDNPARLHSLQAIASQAAVAVGTTLMCIDRAQRLAVQDERLRIAQDIHDTTSQTLFGLHYALDACAKLLPDHPGQVKAELKNLSEMAETARTQVRQSILNLWPTVITAERFTADLQKFAREHFRADSVDLTIDVRGGFQQLSPGARRGLYRIAQEAITNVAQHAAASQVSVCLDVQLDEALLAVRDNGRGFDPAPALARERNREHFGLRGMQERAVALGGIAEFLSQPGAGTTVIMTLPLNGESARV
jgi:signal transduction histidine kinase